MHRTIARAASLLVVSLSLLAATACTSAGEEVVGSDESAIAETADVREGEVDGPSRETCAALEDTACRIGWSIANACALPGNASCTSMPANHCQNGGGGIDEACRLRCEATHCACVEGRWNFERFTAAKKALKAAGCSVNGGIHCPRPQNGLLTNLCNEYGSQYVR